MNKEQKLLGYYNYTVVLTYIGMLTGFLGVVYAFEENITRAVVCLMIAGVCDMFDGTIASTKKRDSREKCFGIQIDSLSDLICFGVLPASIIYNLNKYNRVVLGVAAVYVLCALMRLAYFNVDEQERQKSTTEGRKVYYGMPVTLSAVFVPVIYWLANRFGVQSYVGMAGILAVMAVLFLLPFQIKKPQLTAKLCLIGQLFVRS